MLKNIFGTKEWSNHSFNCISGCYHGCKYCYAKNMAIRYGRKSDYNDWKKEILINKIDKIKKLNGIIMFPTTHDITVDNYDHILKHIIRHLEIGNKLLIVTKADDMVIQEIIKELKIYKDNILFRITIGTSDSNTLLFYEPNAPDYHSRLNSLRILFKNGFKTSISSEPILSDDIDKVIQDCYPYITDSHWLGKINNYRFENNIFDNKLKEVSSIEYVKNLYEKYQNNPRIKWKESIKKIVGIKLLEKAGLDK